MSSPKVSVVVPTFNSSAYIESTLLSVTTQSLRDLEIIVVDDASTDGTVKQIEQLASNDSRIRLLISDRNRGPAFSRNLGIDASAGAWIAILDSDDWMRPDRLEILTATAEVNGFDVVADNILFVHKHGDAPFDNLLPAELFRDSLVCRIDTSQYLRFNLPSGKRGIGLIKPVVRTDILRVSKVRYREELRFAEDMFFCLDLLLSGAQFGLLQRGMYEYLVRPNSLARSSTESDIARMIESFDLILADDRVRKSSNIERLLQHQKREIEFYSLPRYRFISALRSHRIGTCARILWTHPKLPFQILARSPYFGGRDR